MTEEIFKVMKYFGGSFINSHGELIISKTRNVYFKASDCNNKEDVICKLIEWCSGPIVKGEPHDNTFRNIKWRLSLLRGYNNYLGTDFTFDDMRVIYDRLGNAVDHSLTLKFIRSNYDLSILKEEK